jgi:hypothetical protein
MVKLLVFAILLASSPATGLIETLFRAENSCYTGCHSNYAATPAHLEACRQGCDFKLHNEQCATKCISRSTDVQIQNSCQVGCTLSRLETGESVQEKPVIAVDPVPEDKESGVIPPANPEQERPRSIILIRLRQRPSLEMPSVQRIMTNDPVQFFNNIIKQFQEKANDFEENIRKSFDQNSKDFPKPPEFGSISELVKNIPLIRLPGNIREDSSSESSEETNGKRPLVDDIKHAISHPHFRERVQPIHNRVKQFFTDVRSEWNDLVRKQPKIPIWIFLGILLSSSAILWYMVMSLCRHTPSRNALSIRAQELVFHPYEYDAYEKEKIQPDDQPYEVTESLPIKVKLSNI